MSERLVPNAHQWVDIRVNDFWDALQSQVPDDSWMPVEMRDEALSYVELGCGNFGCVMPTGREDTVFKLTTDASEAMFARVAIHLSDAEKEGTKWDPGVWPAGIVRYKGVYHLKGAELGGNPIFALWRDEASEIGFVHDMANDEFGHFNTEIQQYAVSTIVALAEIKKAAEKIRQTAAVTHIGPDAEAFFDDLRLGAQRVLTKERPFIEERFGTLEGGLGRRMGWSEGLMEATAFALAVYEVGVDAIGENELIGPVADAMSYYLSHGIVLGDVHARNIGYLFDEETWDKEPAITDPGLATFLTKEYDSLSIDELESDAS